MILNRKYLLLIFVALLFSALAQHKDTIEWRYSYRLTWPDFKAAPDEKSPIGALTGASIAYDAQSQGAAIVCTVVCFFDRERSWVKPKNKLDYVLAHEQGHFDLYEIYCRKLRKKLTGKNFKQKNLSRDLKKIINKVIAEAQEIQKKYDKATGFAFNTSNQKKWSDKIAKELKELENYPNKPITLKIK